MQRTEPSEASEPPQSVSSVQVSWRVWQKNPLAQSSPAGHTQDVPKALIQPLKEQ
jgi:hypothetical protein